MDRQQAAKLMLELLRMMLARKGSDLFISADFPPACKLDGKLTPLVERPFRSDETAVLVRAIMNDHQIRDFDATKECNFAINPPGIGRFRVNAFIQQARAGMVLRVIPTEIPTLEQLRLPPILNDLVLTKRGMLMVVGGTGSGKSTTLAAMIGHRNLTTHGHIITIEDPIEFVHGHQNCLITQREVGVDTDSWDNALVNTLRQAPDVILIGEVRTRETMEHAINFSETGHLCLFTLHANSANQALDRIINLFPEERRSQLLMDLSLNMRAIISQRLLPKVGGGRVAAVEIMINSPLIQDLVFKGKVHEIKTIMQKSKESGMQTFDMALFDLYEAGLISYEDALRTADSMNELRLKIKLEGKDARERDTLGSSSKLSILDDTHPEPQHIDFGA
jgi:twitching motility protein PilU